MFLNPNYCLPFTFSYDSYTTIAGMLIYYFKTFNFQLDFQRNRLLALGISSPPRFSLLMGFISVMSV